MGLLPVSTHHCLKDLYMFWFSFLSLSPAPGTKSTKGAKYMCLLACWKKTAKLSMPQHDKPVSCKFRHAMSAKKLILSRNNCSRGRSDSRYVLSCPM
eukprot:CAMPEP_0177279608 /NCGR_PEP_ID=MMETSP0367-20130122/69924_1 /TAXON_ID=447022 ORGANISM="Scrippsiella hangoei-like, Strain SHHI-4" /NCGR_SAMPLE_ID=MMETSP0367 /ASSEMBLY_ACC=CAM_ASM_000362 /LENGTH=96 /DNA_ID=CAMNT_0018736287 /DNA_START=76 /DNA_END=366 /DNA_ORIENTATION=+